MITKITMENIKGQNAVQELTGRDIILGRNGAGKTTRMQAIGLAMNGYVPGKGKTVADTFKLASGEAMTVGLETETFEMTRTFVEKKKLNKDGDYDVTIKQELDVRPSAGERTNADKEARITQELGAFPTMLDFGSFIALTDNKKRDFIYNLSGNTMTWDRDRVMQELEARAGDGNSNPDYNEVHAKNMEETMKQYKEGMDVQAGLLAMTEYAKDQLKYWKKEKANAEGAAKKLTELKNRSAQTDRDLAENQQQLQELNERRDEIIKALSEAATNNKNRIDQQQKLEKIISEIAELEKDVDAESIKALEEEIKVLEQIIEGASEKPFEELEKKLMDDKVREDLNKKEWEAKLDELKQKRATNDAEIKSNSDLLKRIEERNGCCAFSQKMPCNQDFTEFIQQTNDILDDAYEQKDRIADVILEAEKMLKATNEALQDIEKEKKDLQNELREYRKTMDNHRSTLDAKKKELEAINGREPALAAKKELKAVIEAEIEKTEPVDLTGMNDQKALVSSQIEALTQAIEQQKKVQNDLINIKANIIDSHTAEYNVMSWKCIADTIGQGGIQGEMTKEMLGPIKNDIDQKIKAIGLNQEMFFDTESDRGKEIFMFGFNDINTGVKRPFDALSTGEQLIFMIVLMTTIIERQAPPVKILAIDNINDLDKQNLHIVLKGLNTVGNTMDNIILSGVAEPEEADTEGWTVWRL